MQSDNRHFSNAIDARVGPRTWGQIGYGSNIQVIAERGLGSFSRLGGLAGKSQDHLIDEFGASEPVEVRYSPQHRLGKRLVVIHEAADGGAVQRIVAQRPGDGASDRPPANDQDLARFGVAPPPLPYSLPQAAQQRESGQATGKYSGGGEKMHAVPRSDEYQPNCEQG